MLVAARLVAALGRVHRCWASGWVADGIVAWDGGVALVVRGGRAHAGSRPSEPMKVPLLVPLMVTVRAGTGGHSTEELRVTRHTFAMRICCFATTDRVSMPGERDEASCGAGSDTGATRPWHIIRNGCALPTGQRLTSVVWPWLCGVLCSSLGLGVDVRTRPSTMRESGRDAPGVRLRGRGRGAGMGGVLAWHAGQVARKRVESGGAPWPRRTGSTHWINAHVCMSTPKEG